MVKATHISSERNIMLTLKIYEIILLQKKTNRSYMNMFCIKIRLNLCQYLQILNLDKYKKWMIFNSSTFIFDCLWYCVHNYTHQPGFHNTV